MSERQWPFEIHGTEPRHLIGKPCDAFLVQQYWHKGKLAESANVAYLKFGGEWIGLSIDAGVIFWREQSEAPKEAQKELVGEDFSYPIVNVGASHGLDGLVLTDIVAKPISGGTTVIFLFQSGVELMVNNIDDNTSFSVSRRKLS